MDNSVCDQLSDVMQMDINRKASFVVLSTIDPSGCPSAIPVGSLVARGPACLVMSLRENQRSLDNIRQNCRVALLHVGPRVWLTIKGRATVCHKIPGSAERFAAPLLVVKVDVDEVTAIKAIVQANPFTFWTWDVDRLQALNEVRDYLMALDVCEAELAGAS